MNTKQEIIELVEAVTVFCPLEKLFAEMVDSTLVIQSEYRDVYLEIADFESDLSSCEIAEIIPDMIKAENAPVPNFKADIFNQMAEITKPITEK